MAGVRSNNVCLVFPSHVSRKKWLNNRPPSGAEKCTKGGRAICFSACRDDEMATDSNVRVVSSSMLFEFSSC